MLCVLADGFGIVSTLTLCGMCSFSNDSCRRQVIYLASQASDISIPSVPS